MSGKGIRLHRRMDTSDFDLPTHGSSEGCQLWFDHTVELGPLPARLHRKNSDFVNVLYHIEIRIELTARPRASMHGFTVCRKLKRGFASGFTFDV
eukprot:210055-Prymnesium_polylepis.1